MNSNLRKNLLLVGLAAVALVLAADPAMAQNAAAMGFNGNGKTIGAVANNITTSLKGTAVLITMFCYLGALIFGVTGAMKFKAYSEQPDRTPIKVPITFWAIAVLLAGFPEFMGTGITTLWGGGGNAQLVTQP